MGLDIVVKRDDGRPLGPLDEVQQALSAAFSGIEFGREPSGAEKIRAAEASGIIFPDVIRQQFESAPAHHAGDYEGPDFSAQFGLGAGEIIQAIDVVLYGTTAASEPMFAYLKKNYGWITTPD